MSVWHLDILNCLDLIFFTYKMEIKNPTAFMRTKRVNTRKVIRMWLAHNKCSVNISYYYVLQFLPSNVCFVLLLFYRMFFYNLKHFWLNHHCPNILYFSQTNFLVVLKILLRHIKLGPSHSPIWLLHTIIYHLLRPSISKQLKTSLYGSQVSLLLKSCHFHRSSNED